MYETINYEVKNNIGYITISRPKALNAINNQVLDELYDVCTKIEKDDDVRVVILTGEGKAFVAGADIAEMNSLDSIGGRNMIAKGHRVMNYIESIEKPFIAAINGFALGGGCELSMACDFRIASEKAKFGQPEVGLGITPGAGGTQRLPRLVGIAKAKELLYTARVIGAEEALSIGLVNKVVPHDELMNEAMAMAQMICGNGQIAVQEVKKCINYGMQTDIATGVSYEQQSFAVTNSTEDKRNAMTAFVNKQKDKNFVYR